MQMHKIPQKNNNLDKVRQNKALIINIHVLILSSRAAVSKAIARTKILLINGDILHIDC